MIQALSSTRKAIAARASTPGTARCAATTICSILSRSRTRCAPSISPISAPAPTSSPPTRSPRPASRRPITAWRRSPYELNLEGARLAREAAAHRARARTAAPRFVAGAIGPTNRTASISPDVSNPGFRAITFDELRAAYGEQVARPDRRRRRSAADRDHLRHAQRQGRDLRHRRSVRGARRRRAGDDLRHHHRPVRPPAVRARRRKRSGIRSRTPRRSRSGSTARSAPRRCAPISPISAASPTRWSAPIPMPACPTNSATTTKSPEYMAALIGEFAAAGLVNIVGGCCGTTPEHIRAIAAGGAPARRRARFPTSPPRLRLSGLEPFTLTPEIPFVNVGERTNVTGSARFRKLITAGDYAGGARGRARPGRERRPDHRRQHGRGPARFRAGDDDLPQSDRRRARHRPRAGDDRFLEIQGDRGRAEMRAGQGGRQFDLAQGRRGRLHPPGPDRAPLRRRRRGDGVRRSRARPTRSSARPRSASAPTTSWSTRVGFPPQDIIFDPNIFAVATGMEEHNGYGVAFIEAARWIRAEPAARPCLRRRFQSLVLVPRQ